MRLWHYKLLQFLPDAQFKGQLRELVAIMHDWRDKGKTNHLLINRVMEYPKEELYHYWVGYRDEWYKRGLRDLSHYDDEFYGFSNGGYWYSECRIEFPYEAEWHNKEYLRVCMANLYEKHNFGIGKSRITDEEWQRLCEGYKTITGEDYLI